MILDSEIWLFEKAWWQIFDPDTCQVSAIASIVLKIREANNAIMPAPTGELFWKAEIVIKPIKISARLQSLAEPWERIDHNYKLHGVG
jgi:hypothetical protein